MREDIEKILEEFDARYGHLSTASMVVHLYGSHGKMIADIRQFLENALKKRHKKVSLYAIRDNDRDIRQFLENVLKKKKKALGTTKA